MQTEDPGFVVFGIREEPILFWNGLFCTFSYKHVIDGQDNEGLCYPPIILFSTIQGAS